MLKLRRHNLTLSVITDARYFAVRQLFRDFPRVIVRSFVSSTAFTYSISK